MIPFSNSFYDYLIGVWALHRSVTNGSIMEGMAILEPKQPSKSLYYREHGKIITPQNYVTHFEQEYVYEFCSKSLLVSLYFSRKKKQGDLFMVFDQQGNGQHVCQKDLYQGSLSFISDCVFSLSYRINGPRKNYTIETFYYRKDEIFNRVIF